MKNRQKYNLDCGHIIVDNISRTTKCEILINKNASYEHFYKFERLYVAIFNAVYESKRHIRLLLDISRVEEAVPISIAVRVANLIMKTRHLSRGRLETVTVITQSESGAAVLGVVFGMVSPSAPISVYKDPEKALNFFNSTEKLEKTQVYYFE